MFSTVKLLSLLLGIAAAVPMAHPEPARAAHAVEKRASSYWLPNVQKQGAVPYDGSSGYQVYRNVADFGAVGDGSTDDTDAINNAISSGGRCGLGCDSSTTSPALVYFPPGKYLVSKPIVQYYYTQLVGDAVSPPTIVGSSGFQGIALIDSDPYESGGANWYTNQNNFYRQVRNFVIDLTQMPMSQGAGIHWQVAQATSLQNIVFNMVQGGGSDNKQSGIFMDNGSGGFMTDLVFNGGNYGAFFGNQQFTTRNLTFNGCNTAVYMNFNWLWSLKSLSINNCGVGVDMSNNPTDQNVGSVIIQDSTISNTPVGVITAFTGSSTPPGAGTLILDNVDFSNNCPTAVQSNTGATILGGGGVTSSWAQGRRYVNGDGSTIQQALNAPSKPGNLLDSRGRFVEQSKRQYENLPASAFVSVKSAGAKGDGVTDDTQAIQNAMNSIGAGQVLYFDYGAYVISSTVHVPKDITIVGEAWSQIMASGSAFQDQSNPQPVWQVGEPGDVGTAQLSELLFATIGPQPGAILIQWNVAGSSPGAAGMWDVHARVGGAAGTQLQSDTCSKDPSVTAGPNAACEGAFLLFHATSSASVYVENSWFWVADHELDRGDHNQINVFNGRGVLIESTAGTWLYGTAAEHSVLYNYALGSAQNVYMSAIQTETPYYQANPDATAPFTAQSAYYDPDFSSCNGAAGCAKAWGVRIVQSSDVFIFASGLYSFFDNYDQTCLDTESCQSNMVDVTSSSNVYLYALSTKAAVNMVTQDGQSQALDADNRSSFCATVALWSQQQ